MDLMNSEFYFDSMKERVAMRGKTISELQDELRKKEHLWAQLAGRVEDLKEIDIVTREGEIAYGEPPAYRPAIEAALEEVAESLSETIEFRDETEQEINQLKTDIEEAELVKLTIEKAREHVRTIKL